MSNKFALKNIITHCSNRENANIVNKKSLVLSFTNMGEMTKVYKLTLKVSYILIVNCHTYKPNTTIYVIIVNGDIVLYLF